MCLDTTRWCVLSHDSPEEVTLIAPLQARQLLPHLYGSGHADGGRIIWTGSLDGRRVFYDPKDPMALNTNHSYASTKLQGMLLAWEFNRLIAQHEGVKPGQNKVRSYVVSPGIAASNMFADIRQFILFMLLRDVCLTQN